MLKVKQSFLLLIFFAICLTINNTSVKASNFKAVVDITTLDVYEIQEAVDKGYLTYELLTNLYLDRINKYESDYNAIISINEKALSLAKELDKEYKKSGRRSILHGIPIIIKDNIDYIELPTTAGTKALKDSYPLKNSVIVKNLIEAGAIILAKSNMSEFAFSAYNSYSSYGSVKNAYNLAYTTYGSSGGSAVSVAASLATLAVGTDTNSSVRLPASANNIVGLRPTYGLLSSKGIIAYDAERDTAGPMTKTVTDNAILLSLLADNGIDYTEFLKKDGLKGKKIGVLTQFIEKDSNSSIPVLAYYYKEIDDMMDDAINTMEQQGATIVYIDELYSSYYQNLNNNTSLITLLCYDFNQYIKNTTSSIKSFSSLIANGGYVQNLSQYNVSCNTDLRDTRLNSVNKLKDEYRNHVEDIIDEYNVDVLVYPETKNKLLKLSEIYTKTIANNTYTISPTTGFPAISIPLGFDSNDLPYGIEFLALANQENILYELSYSFEQATNNKKNPSIAPSLYDVSANLEKLKDYFENNNIKSYHYKKEAYDEYYTAYEKVNNLLLNYNDYDPNTIEDVTNELVIEYEAKVENLLLNKRLITSEITFVVIIPAIGGLLLLLVLIKIFKRKRRKKRRQRR